MTDAVPVRVLVTDDDDSNRASMTRILEREGYEVLAASSGEQALDLLREARPAVMITDLRMPGMSGQELLKAARVAAPDTEVVMVTAYGSVEVAVDVMKFGAYDFLTKPFKRAELVRAVRQAIERHTLRTENRTLRERLAAREADPAPRHGIVGTSPAISRLLTMLEQVAPTQATVLITGESGTGKELVAEALHRSSPRAKGPLVKVACAALPDNLLEAELFGHEAGAFTGATRTREGRFEAADGGTIFLDEIGEIPPPVQVKLLRVLQESEFERIGSSKTRKVDIRVIAATNADLRQAVADRDFREDLYYRLNVIHLHVPALRDRAGDPALLAHHFLRRYAEREGKALTGISEEALAVMERYPWPGNVRQLKNALERAAILSPGPQVELGDLPFELQEFARESGVEARPRPAEGGRFMRFAVGTPLKEIERVAIRETLEQSDGDKNLAARLLGITVRTIYRRLEEERAREEEPG